MLELVCGYGDVGRVAHSLSVVWCSWSLPNEFSAMLAAKVDTCLASDFFRPFVLGVRTFFPRPLVSATYVFEAGRA